MDLQIEQLIVLIPLLPLAGAITNGLFGHRLPRPLVGLVACLTVLGSACISAYAFFGLMADGAPKAYDQTLYTWIAVDTLSLDVRLVIDHLSAIMIMVVCWVGFLIHVYSWGYMAEEHSLARYYAYLNLFMFAMLMLVLGDSLPLMFIGWEGVGLCSYLLIGFWYTDSEKASAGKKAFIVNRIGDFGFILAMLILFRATDTLQFEKLANLTAGGQIGSAVAIGACLLLLLGATGKSAQLPLFTWLPDAMAGPTPVSALIHAATMVTAGVYMVCRMGFLYQATPIAMVAVTAVGAITALIAASIGTAQNDIKKVLAYSTVSQLGFMFIAAGVGAYAIAIFHLVTHAFFKGCLFLGSGSVIHGMGGEQNMRQMGGLWKKQPITFITFFASTLAITGFPLTAGFMSKDAILWHAFAAGNAMGNHPTILGHLTIGLWLVGAFAAGLTAFYMWRLVFMTFFSGETRAKDVHVHESPWSMTVPLIILGLASLVGGFFIGIPPVIAHLWGSEAKFEAIVRWLQPVVSTPPITGEHAALEWGLMAGSTSIAIIGFIVAYLLYGRSFPSKAASSFASGRWTRWIYLQLREKWHFDELYDAVVVRPIGWVSNVVLYEAFDVRVVDGLVNLVAGITKRLGFFFQLFQNGNIQRYLAIFAIGVAVLIYGWLTPPVYDADPPPPTAQVEAGGAR